MEDKDTKTENNAIDYTNVSDYKKDKKKPQMRDKLLVAAVLLVLAASFLPGILGLLFIAGLGTIVINNRIVANNRDKHRKSQEEITKADTKIKELSEKLEQQQKQQEKLKKEQKEEQKKPQAETAKQTETAATATAKTPESPTKDLEKEITKANSKIEELSVKLDYLSAFLMTQRSGLAQQRDKDGKPHVDGARNRPVNKNGQQRISRPRSHSM